MNAIHPIVARSKCNTRILDAIDSCDNVLAFLASGQCADADNLTAPTITNLVTRARTLLEQASAEASPPNGTGTHRRSVAQPMRNG